MIVYKHKNPGRLIVHENQPVIDDIVDIDVLRREAERNKALHGKVMWEGDGRNGERREVRFDRPTGDVLPVDEFTRRKKERSLSNCKKYSFTNKKGRKSHLERGEAEVKENSSTSILPAVNLGCVQP